MLILLHLSIFLGIQIHGNRSKGWLVTSSSCRCRSRRWIRRHCNRCRRRWNGSRRGWSVELFLNLLLLNLLLPFPIHLGPHFVTILPIGKSTHKHIDTYISEFVHLGPREQQQKQVVTRNRTYFGGNAFVVRSHSLLSAASAVVRFDGSSVNISSSKLKAHGDNSLNQVNHNQMNQSVSTKVPIIINKYQRNMEMKRVDRERERERENLLEMVS